MNSCAPISGFVCPSAGEPRDLRLLGRQVVARRRRCAVRTVSPVASSSRRARSANASAPMLAEHLVRECAAARARRTRRFSRRSHSPYSEVRASELEPACGSGRAARSPRGTASSAAGSARAARGSAPRRPSAQSVRAGASSLLRAGRSASDAMSSRPLRHAPPRRARRGARRQESPRSSSSHARLAAVEGASYSAEAVVQDGRRILGRARSPLPSPRPARVPEVVARSTATASPRRPRQAISMSAYVRERRCCRLPRAMASASSISAAAGGELPCRVRAHMPGR